MRHFKSQTSRRVWDGPINHYQPTDVLKFITLLVALLSIWIQSRARPSHIKWNETDMHIEPFQFSLSHHNDLKNVFNKLCSQIYDHRILSVLSRPKTRYFAEPVFPHVFRDVSKEIFDWWIYSKKNYQLYNFPSYMFSLLQNVMSVKWTTDAFRGCEGAFRDWKVIWMKHSVLKR